MALLRGVEERRGAGRARAVHARRGGAQGARAVRVPAEGRDVQRAAAGLASSMNATSILFS